MVNVVYLISVEISSLPYILYCTFVGMCMLFALPLRDESKEEKYVDLIFIWQEKATFFNFSTT